MNLLDMADREELMTQRDELLAALRAALDQYDIAVSRDVDANRKVSPQWTHDARAAIAKVEGK